MIKTDSFNIIYELLTLYSNLYFNPSRARIEWLNAADQFATIYFGDIRDNVPLIRGIFLEQVGNFIGIDPIDR